MIAVEVKIVSINEWYKKETKAWKEGSVTNHDNFMVLSLTDVCKDRNVQTKEGPIVEIIWPT